MVVISVNDTNASSHVPQTKAPPSGMSKLVGGAALLLMAVVGASAVVSSGSTASANVAPGRKLEFVSMPQVQASKSVYQEVLYNAGSDTYRSDAYVPATKFVDVPDAVAKFERHTGVYDTDRDFNANYATEMGIPYTAGMFSGSASLTDKRKKLEDPSHSVLVGTSSVTVKTAEAVLDPNFVLSSVAGLSQTLSALTPETTTDHYFLIFNSFGTHYVSEVDMGGMLTTEYDITVEKTGFDISDPQLIPTMEAAAEYTFALAVKDDGVSKTVTANELANFQTASKSAYWHITARGGDPIAVDNVDYWLPSVADYPTSIGSRLAPLTDLIPAAMTWQSTEDVTAVQSGMAKAAEEYYSVCPVVEGEDGSSKVCNGRGVCSFSSHTCACDEGASGDACNAAACPRDADTNVECGAHGSCDQAHGTCVCEEGYVVGDSGTCVTDCSDGVLVGSSTFNNQSVVQFSNHCLDYCLHGEGDTSSSITPVKIEGMCGIAVADAFCQWNGFPSGALNFTSLPGEALVVQNATAGQPSYCSTISLEDQNIHDSWKCGGFFTKKKTCYPTTFIQIICKKPGC